MKIKAKYRIKIADVYVEQGTIGETGTLEDARKLFPNINYSTNTNLVCAKFPGAVVCIVHRDQVEFVK